MSCACTHTPICHAYALGTCRNDGPCLVPGCGCAGTESDEGRRGGPQDRVREVQAK